MSQFPNQNTPLPQLPIAPPPNRPDTKWRFRWGIGLVPAACLLGAWLYAAIEPASWWTQQMARMGIVDREAFTGVVVLGIALVGLLCIVRVLRRDPEPEE